MSQKVKKAGRVKQSLGPGTKKHQKAIRNALLFCQLYNNSIVVMVRVFVVVIDFSPANGFVRISGIKIFIKKIFTLCKFFPLQEAFS